MNRRIIISIILLIVFPGFLFSQQRKSIHQLEYEEHSHISKKQSLYKTSEIKINPNRSFKSELKSAVFGYLPDWEYTAAPANLQYDLLSHIAAFDFLVSADGDISYPSFWPWVNVINEAHENGVKMIMTIVNFDADGIHTILNSATIQESFFANVKSIIEEFDLQGVNIDFEGIYEADRGNILNAFMENLTIFLHRELPGSEVSFAGPAVNWGGWDLAGLASACDYIFIMGYNYYGSWSSTSGAVAPLTGGSINITNTVEAQYSEVTNNNPEKLILGVPYYGNLWETRNSSAYTSVIEYISHPRYRTAVVEAETYGWVWDYRSKTSWYTYQQNSKYYQVWMDNDQSLGLKYDLAESKSFKGVGMWALGYDGDKPGLWNELRKRYGDVSDVTEINSPALVVDQNFPNPFKTITTISYKILTGSEVTITIFDQYGRKINELLDMHQIAGKHKIKYNGSHLSNGVYYCQIKVKTNPQNYVELIKMILLR